MLVILGMARRAAQCYVLSAAYFLHNGSAHTKGHAMKQLWIEDFLTLVDAGRSPGPRHCATSRSRPSRAAYSSWKGVAGPGADRPAQPHPRLDACRAAPYPGFRMLLRDMAQLRTRMQSEQNGLARLVLATQHSLTMSRLPALLTLLGEQDSPRIEFSVRSENRDDCVALFLGAARPTCCCA